MGKRNIQINKPKLLFIVPRFHTNLYYRLKALKGNGFELNLIALKQEHSECHDIIKPNILDYSPIYNFLEKIRYKIFKNNPSDKWKLHYSWPSLIKFYKQIKKNNPDIIFIRGVQSFYFLISLIISRILNKKIFVLMQVDKYYAENWKKKISLFILKKIFKVQKIITPLKNTLNKQDSFFEYLPFIIESKNFEKKYFLNNKINILDIGKFVQRKDHLTLIKAINKLKNKYSITLTIVGEKRDREYLNEILNYIQKNNLEKIVKIKFNLKYKEVLNIYKKFDLFVLPSYNEPAAYSILEAMVNKLPIICSDTCGTKCYIKNKENGYIFKSKNVDDLVNKIELIIKKKDNLMKIGRDSFELVQKYYSPKNFIKKFKDIV